MVGVHDEEFATFVAEHWSTYVRMLVLMGSSQADAEDTVQQGLVQAFKAWGRVRGADNPTAYAARIVLNLARRSGRRPAFVELDPTLLDEPDHDDHASETARRDWIQSAVRRLPIKHVQVLVCRFYLDLSEADTAAALGVSPGTVKSRTSRALAALRLDPTLTRTGD